MLKLLVLIIVLASAERNIFSRDSKVDHQFCHLTSKIISTLNPLQIVLLVDSSVNLSRIGTKDIEKCIFQNYITITLDYQCIHVLKDLMKFPVFGSPRSSSIFITLKTSNDLNINNDSSRLNDILSEYTAIWSKSIRPRILMMYLNNNVSFTKTFEPLLLQAWHYKFLDFTILETRNFNDSIVHHYNPFTNHTKTELFTEGTNLFPDKLHDMNGYPLKTMFLHEPPTLYLQQNASGHILTINSTDYWVVKTVSKAINFTLVCLPAYTNDYVNKMERPSFAAMRSAIHNGTLDFSGNQMYLWKPLILEYGYVLEPDGHRALLPVMPMERLKIPQNIHLVIIFTILYVLVLSVAVRMLKFDENFWTWLNMFRVSLSNGSKVLEKIHDFL